MPKKILLIEDNEKNRLLIYDILTYYGYDVLQAVDGDPGLKMASEHKPDLILLDIQMPKMDGYTFIQKIKEIPELINIKIIVITSFAMKGDKENILKIGAAEVIIKPIDTRQLPKIVEKYIGPAEEASK